MEYTLLNKLKDESWKDIKEIVVFGCGRNGKKVVRALKKEFNILAIVDNNIVRLENKYEDIPLLTVQDAESLLKKYKVVVTTNAYNYRQISLQLENMGLKEGHDFIMAQQFIIEYFYKYRNKVYINNTSMPITSLCSLKCENCQLYIPYWKCKFHVPLKEIEKNLDSYFNLVDYVSVFDVLGGEPFLHPDIEDILEYVGKYRKHMSDCTITTNGTITLSQKIFSILKKYDMTVCISDYSGMLNYGNKVNELCASLEENQIHFFRNTDIIWYDFGFPKKKFCYDDETVEKHMRICNTMCHALADGRFYYCINSWAAHKGGLMKEDTKGYLELDEISADNMDEKKKILEYCLGNIEGGYLELCKFCGGYGADNDNKVVTAQQL